jgi:hypothetical protein
MAEVDIGSLYIMTVPPTVETLDGRVVHGTASVELYWGADIAPGQWFQAAIHITPGQIGGTSAGITQQGVAIDNNGSTGLWVNVGNFSSVVPVSQPVEVSINVLSAPGHGF